TPTPGGTPAAPTLSSFALSAMTVDVSSGPQTLGLAAGVVAAAGGLTDTAPTSSVVVQPPGGAAVTVDFGTAELTSGTPDSGVYAPALVLDATSPTGTWTITGITLRDVAG